MTCWELDDDRMNFQLDDVDDQGPFDHYHHHYHHQDNSQVHGLSRLATCTTSNSTLDCENFDVQEHNDIGFKTMSLSRLSIESIDFGGDADEEFSDSPGQEDNNCLSSEYENEKRQVSAPAGCFSLPGTPLGHRRHQGLLGNMKHYASENETRKLSKNDRRRRWKRRVLKRENMKVDDDDDEENLTSWRSHGNSFSGESENGGGLRVITRPKGGEHSLCMDMEEVKACRDLGFELELDTKMIMPSRLTISAPLLDTGGGATTSSGGSSPISNWRISGPGDDPKDVKARLKVWAQAVALASTSPRSGGSC